MEPEEHAEENWEEEKPGVDLTAPPPETRPADQIEEIEIKGPGRIVDRQQAPIWLQQGRLEMIAARKLAEAFEGFRSLPAACVWHCEQVVEMAIKAAMLRTC